MASNESTAPQRVLALAGGGALALFAFGAIVATAQRRMHAIGSPAVDMLVPFSVPPPSPLPNLRVVRDDQRASGLAQAGSIEAIDMCGQCKGRCQLFDASSPLCCTAQCARQCPQLMASVGCAGQANGSSSQPNGSTTASSIGGLLLETLGIGREGAGASSGDAHGTTRRTAASAQPGSAADMLRSEVLCPACNLSFAALGVRHGCSPSCRAACPPLMSALGCPPEEAIPVCFNCRSTCSLLGIDSYSTRLMCCSDECHTYCPALLSGLGCPADTATAAQRLARTFGLDARAFRDETSARACEGCVAACAAEPSSPGCCSAFCGARCRPAHASVPGCKPQPPWSPPPPPSPQPPRRGGRPSAGPLRSRRQPHKLAEPSSQPSDRPARPSLAPAPTSAPRGVRAPDSRRRGSHAAMCNAPLVGEVRLASYPLGVAQVYTGVPTARVADAAHPDFGWRTLCGAHADRRLQPKWERLHLAKVLCRQLGYERADSQAERDALAGSAVDVSAPFQCASGREKSFAQCSELPSAQAGACTSAVVVGCEASDGFRGPAEPRCGSAALLGAARPTPGPE